MITKIVASLSSVVGFVNLNVWGFDGFLGEFGYLGTEKGSTLESSSLIRFST